LDFENIVLCISIFSPEHTEKKNMSHKREQIADAFERSF